MTVSTSFRTTRRVSQAALALALVFVASRGANAQTATFVSPINGQTNVNLTQPITWTSVSGAQAYYLYVGTAPGLKDIIDSYETQQTSWPATAIPTNQTVYARIHTKSAAGQWSYNEISFSGFQAATFLSPSNGQTCVNLLLPITWSSVPGAQAYRLSVGTTSGSN